MSVPDRYGRALQHFTRALELCDEPIGEACEPILSNMAHALRKLRLKTLRT